MKMSKAIQLYKDYQTATLKPGTVRGYEYVLNLLEKLYTDHEVETLTTANMTSCLDFLTGNLSKSSKHLRFT